MAYESGFTAACNILALNVPFHYVPIRFIDLPKGRLFMAGCKGGRMTDSSTVFGDV
jgi:hypothetical protein